jgi:hypothetical protein
MPAKDITVPTFDGKTFRCIRCGDFDVSGTVLSGDLLAQYDRQSRVDILDRAKRTAQPGKRPMITTDAPSR